MSILRVGKYTKLSIMLGLMLPEFDVRKSVKNEYSKGLGDREYIMGMTLWIHTLEGRNYLKDSNDHSLMNKNLDSLDALCTKMKVKKLSDYVDYTDQQFNYNEFYDNDNEPELKSETELAYGIDDMTWFEASDGLISLQTVRNRIAKDRLHGLDADKLQSLLEELDDCISILDDSVSRGGKFHLSLVE